MFATIETGGTFDARMGAQIIRPAAFLYLDWPTGEIFVGTVGSVADFTHRRTENGWVTDASLEVTNGRNPRRAIQNHHSPETAENGDTAWRLLPTVARQQPWPTSR